MAQCLESLHNQARLPEDSGGTEPAGPAMEVLVVDNASTDGSQEMVRERFPSIRLLPNDANLGFARANNQAILQSRGRYLLLLNPDTVVQPGALQSLVAFMDTHPEAGAAGAKLLNPDGSLQVSCHPAPTLAREAWRLFHLDGLRAYARYSPAYWLSGEPREVDIAQGACLIVRREVLEETGPLDECFFIYSEEVDLCRRIQEAGYRLYWVPQATVIHHGGQSTRQVAGPMFLRLYEAKVLYFRKHYGTLAVRLYKMVLLLASLARLSLCPLALLEPPDHRRRHLTLAGHYGRLIKSIPGF